MDEAARHETARFGLTPVADEPDMRSAVGVAPRVRTESRPVLETIVSPFHCFYQDALEFHTQCHLRLAVSEAESSRLARAALVLYLAAAEALVHQAAADLAGAEGSRILADPNRPLPPADAWRLLPALVRGASAGPLMTTVAPWPQLAELLEMRQTWAYPGVEHARRAYYRRAHEGQDFEPMRPHDIPTWLPIDTNDLVFPRTGLPRDPYAVRPAHVDTARGILDSAITALDRALGGALTQNARHRRERVRVVEPGTD